MSEPRLSVEKAIGLTETMRRIGWTEERIRQASSTGFLANALGALEGKLDFVPASLDFDGDGPPFIPTFARVASHQPMGRVRWDPLRFRAVRVEGADRGPFPAALLANEPPEGALLANACALDFLVARPHLIPEAWRSDGAGSMLRICFPGTVYLMGLDPFVRHLTDEGNGWTSGMTYLIGAATEHEKVVHYWPKAA